MIIYEYENYNKKPYIHKNRDYVSTEMYLKNSKRYVYDSFIFGSSTALFVTPSVWRNHINTPNNIFSFDASGENIVGIWSKIKYINKTDHKIKNALITIDFSTFSGFINNVPIYMKHNEVYPSSRFTFHYGYFLSFLDPRFLVALAHREISNKFYPYMDDILEDKPYYSDPVTNEYFNVGVLDELKNKSDSLDYYEKRKDKFPDRTGKTAEAVAMINTQHIKMLNDIRNIFNEDSTDFRIMVCPSYDQLEYNRKDLEIIQTIFNKENVFDFSGINEITEKESNFYDKMHFKKYVGKELLDIVYSENTNR